MPNDLDIDIRKWAAEVEKKILDGANTENPGGNPCVDLTTRDDIYHRYRNQLEKIKKEIENGLAILTLPPVDMSTSPNDQLTASLERQSACIERLTETLAGMSVALSTLTHRMHALNQTMIRWERKAGDPVRAGRFADIPMPSTQEVSEQIDKVAAGVQAIPKVFGYTNFPSRQPPEEIIANEVGRVRKSNDIIVPSDKDNPPAIGRLEDWHWDESNGLWLYKGSDTDPSTTEETQPKEEEVAPDIQIDRESFLRP